MDLKKIMALAMIVFLAIPNLTMVRADDPEDGAGLADAIERAQIYLDKVRTSAETLALEDPEMFQEYLNEIYELLGLNEILLNTTGDVGDEDRIVIPMPSGFTLGELDTISWRTYLVRGYIPHVDIFTEVETLVAEGAHVNNNLITGWATETWFNTFEGATGVYTPDRGITGSTSALSTVNSETAVWFSAADATVLYTLEQFQTPTLVAGMNESTVVTKLEIEIDNWVVQSEAYVDDIEINGVSYGQVKYYLDQASASLDADDFNSSARNLAAARNILGRVKGLLNSMVKAHKVTRIERFMEQVRHRIEGIVDKVDKLSGRFGEGKANKAKASMGRALGNIPQLGVNPSDADVNDAIDKLENTIELINAELATLGVEISDTNILEAMDRLEAKIRVLNATANRLSRKGYDTDAVVDELNNADELLNGILDLLKTGDVEEAESLLKQAGDMVSEASNNIRRIRNQNKGSNGKGNG